MDLTLSLKRFHSVRAATVKFANPTFFVGCNGSGKTNVADAFAFLSEIPSFPLQVIFDRRGGIDAVATKNPVVISEGQRLFPGFREEGYVGLSIEVGDFPGTPHRLLARARYAFEVRARTRFEFEVIREQCIIENEAGRQYFDRNQSKVSGNLPWIGALENWNAPTALLLPVVGNTSPFFAFSEILKGMKVYSIEPGRLREAQAPDSGSALNSDGSNSASVLHNMRQRRRNIVRRVEEILSTIAPHINRVWPIRQGKQMALRFEQSWGNKKIRFDAFNMSDGTLRALGVLLAVFQRPAPSIVVIEEPEATIHPGALGTIMDVLQNAGSSMQVVVTTHSPDVLDTKWITPENIRLVTWEDGTTRISELGETPKAALRQHLMGAGELMRANALDAAEELLFEDPDAEQLDLFTVIQNDSANR